MLKAGLTGGIGSGKSTVARRLTALGVPVIDADLVAREVVASGQPALQQIARAFGEQAIDESGALNRAWLRTKIFENPAARDKLEAITHPAIRRRLVDSMAKPSGVDYIVVDIPLLVEKAYQPLFDVIIVVDCEPEQQLARALARDGGDIESIKGIMRAQSSRAGRLESATHIIDNSSTLASLYQQVNQLHKTLSELAGV